MWNQEKLIRFGFLSSGFARLAATQTSNRQIDAYNRAVALANTGDYRKAAAILEPLVGEVTDPRLAREARTLLKRIHQALAAEPKR